MYCSLRTAPTVSEGWQGEGYGILLLAIDVARRHGMNVVLYVRRQTVPAVRCRLLCENGTAAAKLSAV